MLNGYDIAYGVGVGLASPYWLIGPGARAKVMGAFSERMGKDLRPRENSKPAVMIHAVSLGEINATRSLVRMLGERRPEMVFVISATTDSGFARAKELYGGASNVTVIRYPLDFS